MMKIYDPIKIIDQVASEDNPVLQVFKEDFYKPYIELLNMQVFEPNGYKLVAIKITG